MCAVPRGPKCRKGGQFNRTLQVRIALPVLGRLDRDVLDYAPFKTVFTSFKSTDPPAGHEAPADVAEQTQRCGDVEKDEAGGTR